MQGGKKKKEKKSKEKKIGNQPPPPESSLCSWVPGVLLALQMVTTGPICVKVSQWQLQLGVHVMGSDLSPQSACTPGGAGQGKGSAPARWLSVLQAKQFSAVFSYPSAMRKRSATLVCR